MEFPDLYPWLNVQYFRKPQRLSTDQGIPPNPGYRPRLESVICTLDLLEFLDLYLGFAIARVVGRVALNMDVLLNL